MISLLHVILLPAQCLCIMTIFCLTFCRLTHLAVSKSDIYLRKQDDYMVSSLIAGIGKEYFKAILKETVPMVEDDTGHYLSTLM